MNEISAAPEHQEEEIPQHKIESAAHHMMEAEQVKQNPKLHKAVMAHLDKKKKAISSIQQLRDKAKKLDMEGSPAEERAESPAKEMAEMKGKKK